MVEKESDPNSKDLPSIDEIKSKNKHFEYYPIPIDSFISGSVIKFPIFIKLSDIKYVRIGREGSDISRDRVEYLKKKNVTVLYLKAEDYRKYIGFNLELMPKLVDNQQIDRHRKLKFLVSTSEIILDYGLSGSIDPELFEQTKIVLESSIKLITEGSEIFKILEEYLTLHNILYRHSLGVAFTAGVLLRQLDQQNPELVFNVMMGALFHDIGLQSLEETIKRKSILEMSEAEVEIYKQHPITGIDILKKTNCVPEGVLTIVLQHHETGGDDGFPNKILRSKVHPTARLVALADEFTALTCGGELSMSIPLPAGDAITKLIPKRSTYGVEYFDALKKIFKYND